MTDDDEWNLPTIERIFSSKFTEIARIADDAGLDKCTALKHADIDSLPFNDATIEEFEIDGAVIISGYFAIKFSGAKNIYSINYSHLGSFIAITDEKKDVFKLIYIHQDRDSQEKAITKLSLQEENKKKIPKQISMNFEVPKLNLRNTFQTHQDPYLNAKIKFNEKNAPSAGNLQNKKVHQEVTSNAIKIITNKNLEKDAERKLNQQLRKEIFHYIVNNST